MALRALLLSVMLLLSTLPARADDKARAHAALDWLVGTWETSETLPDGQATGTATFAWTLDGQFLAEDYRNSQGYLGHGLMRWVPSTGEFRMWWFDGEGGSEEYRSAWDGGDRRVLFLQTVRDGKPVSMREVYTRVSDREFRYVLEEDTGDGYTVQWELTARKVGGATER